MDLDNFGFVIARSEAAKQSTLFLDAAAMDWLAEPVIGRRYAPPRWFARTVWVLGRVD
jgi:hypothetical protein